MSKQTEALKLALEWDKRRKYIMPYVVRDAIREALAEQPAIKQDLTPEQPAQQPNEADEYVQKVIDALYENSDPVSVEAAELLEQMTQQQEPVALDVTIEGDSAKLLAAMLEPVLDEEPIPIRLLVGNGHSGHGLYVAAAEYQDEGAALLVNTSPPASKPLTDEQWQVIADTLGCFITRSQKDTIEYALGIKEKNNG